MIRTHLDASGVVEDYGGGDTGGDEAEEGVPLPSLGIREPATGGGPHLRGVKTTSRSSHRARRVFLPFFFLHAPSAFVLAGLAKEGP